MPTAGVRDAYLQTVLTIRLPRLGWVAAPRAMQQLPQPLHVVTAWNPEHARPSLEQNRRSNDSLRAELVLLADQLFDALGSSPDGSHSEESFAVIGASRKTCVAIGARFGQDAIFELTTTEQIVVGCDGHWERKRPFIS